MRSKTLLVFSMMLLLGNFGWSAIDLLSPTNEWNALLYNGPNVLSDALEDHQATSPDLDMVGSTTQTAVYTQFDSIDTLGFRIRVAGDKNPSGFSGHAWVGADVNLDGNLDIFIGANDTEITFNIGGDGDNSSPSSTTIDSHNPLSTAPVTISNYNWSPVTNTNDPLGLSTDIDGDANSNNKSGTDYFLTFTIDFNSFATAVNSLNVVSNFTSASSIAYVVATATQDNSLNSDLNGITGGTNSGSSWTSLGAITPELSVFGTAVPEPATTTLFIAGLSFLFLVVRRRRS